MGPMGDVLSQALQGRVGAVLPLNRSVGGVMKYRPEIDGLRAVAVLSVVLFHLGDKVVSGGYVGVDVFFVISGYLITSLICSERQRGEFSLLSFYVRRIKRIAPALLAMVLASIALGYLVLPPGDYEFLAPADLQWPAHRIFSFSRILVISILWPIPCRCYTLGRLASRNSFI
jgi:peptidoglycan/LPS O-acetylase OafA/YrhL